MTKPASPQQPVVIGKFTGVHGVAGWLKVKPYTETLTGILDYQPWQVTLNGKTHALTVKAHKSYKQEGLIIHLDGCDDRDEAKIFVNQLITVDRDAFPPLEAGHYWIDLQGLTVVTVDGKTLGTVKELIAGPAQDIMVVVQGEHTELIPYVTGPIVKEVKLDERIILVDWEG